MGSAETIIDLLLFPGKKKIRFQAQLPDPGLISGLIGFFKIIKRKVIITGYCHHIHNQSFRKNVVIGKACISGGPGVNGIRIELKTIMTPVKREDVFASCSY